MPNNKNKYIYLTVCFILILLIAVRLFYKLGTPGLHATDEAWYAVNTCEMFQTGNWLVPTLRHEIDYGSKPPLALLLILLSYCAFGVGTFALRFPSAVAGLLIVLVIMYYLHKHYSDRASLIAVAAFSMLTSCFEFHMFRAGDFDALFCLFYVIAICALDLLAKGNSKMFILFAGCVSAGFLTKSMHVAIFGIVFILFLPFIIRKLKLKEFILGSLVCIIPIAIWLILRYPVDGFKFLLAVSVGEVDDQTAHHITLEYIQHALHEPVTIIMLAILVMRAGLYLYKNKTDLSLKKIMESFLEWFKKRYLFIIAYLVPLVIYTFAGSYQMWYTYPSYIICVMIIGLEGASLIDDIKSKETGRVLCIIFILGCMVLCCKEIIACSRIKHEEHFLNQFQHDLASFYAENGSRYDGYHAYIANDRHREYGDRGHWENPFTFYGEATAHWYCIEGGVDGFLSDDESLLVMDKELWDEYADILTGYTVSEQDTYYIFSHAGN